MNAHGFGTRIRAWLTAAGLTALVACGGGQEEQAHRADLPPSPAYAGGQESMAPMASHTEAVLKEGARLNAAELNQIARTGVLPQPFAGPLLSGAEGSTGATLDPAPANKSLGAVKSAASRVPAYRFFNGNTRAHFFTTSAAERDNVIATLPEFSYEGAAFHVSATAVAGLSPVHRFYNTQTGVHFYTISEAERANVAANLPLFNYEGIAYYASTMSGTGYTPLYRFYVSARGFHFYTSSLAERDNIIAALPQYTYEGVGYYVLGEDWQTPAVPHTGINALQCYRAGSNDLIPCNLGPGAQALNPEQDGHRRFFNAMSYSLVGSHPVTDCVRDDVTGLVWEGKTSDGSIRDGFVVFDNLDNSPASATTYAVTVNQMALCGYTDWRVPVVEELHSLVNHGRAVGPKIDTDWFPNSFANAYWAAQTMAIDPTEALFVDLVIGGVNSAQKTLQYRVRLVRGPLWTGPRYQITTIGNLGTNNAVIDRKTGLTWRRCLEGQIWGGNACIGANDTFTHEEALTRAQSQTGWRLPNAKEMVSLMDFSRSLPALDQQAFPGGQSSFLWSSTPDVVNTGNGMSGESSTGVSLVAGRGNSRSIRLVRVEP